ncbi:MAG: hypothetical protein QOK04_2699 [Solirubrobacteraceae bacterium]|nr:hypothetical protein [Solirubrobacteraceae bacterium]
MTVLDAPLTQLDTSPSITLPELDEAAARRDLRHQIARLEAKCCAAVSADFPFARVRPAVRPRGGARLLDLGGLERVRDELAARVRAHRIEAAARATRQAASRQLLEQMRLEPGQHRWVRVSNEDLGEPGCTSYQVRPRLGLLGMLMGWWRVKISSGCP